jgi:hypothetical protein
MRLLQQEERTRALTAARRSPCILDVMLEELSTGIAGGRFDHTSLWIIRFVDYPELSERVEINTTSSEDSGKS